MYSDDGLALRTAEADVDLAQGMATGDRPIEVQGPLGHLQANGFRLSRDGQSLTFTGGVRMTIPPRTAR